MQDRGRLIRRDLVESLRDLSTPLSAALAEFGDDLIVEASDGIGRKTEAPWVRFASARMSPTPRDGFYCVIHFSADGSAWWITLGCGSTIWNGGDLRAIPSDELRRRTDWGRRAIRETFGSLGPFADLISLGAKAALPRTFEQATVVARRFEPSSATSEAVNAALVAAAERLVVIYRGQQIGSHLSSGDLAEIGLEELSRPNSERAQQQGIGLSAAERKAVEERAMAVAIEWLRPAYHVRDVSRSKSFDLEATKDGQVLKVEVKGTTASTCDAVMMTNNEVVLHREECGATALIIVSNIKLRKSENGPFAEGGVLEALIGWSIDDWHLEPMAYRVRRVAKS